DHDALQNAIDTIVARHETLRTAFVTENRDPKQKILTELAVPIATNTMEGASDDELAAHITELARAPFRLDQPPLLHVHLLKVSADEHILLIIIHHIITDGVSMGILMNELAAAYKASVTNTELPLDELSVQYVDFSEWQRKRLQGPELERQLDYWKEQLDGAPELLELPTDLPRPSRISNRGAWTSQQFGPELLENLEQLAKDQNSTLYMVVLAAINVLLNRYSRQDDIVIGVPVAGRDRTELEKIIGFFINTTVVRTDLSDNPSFNDLLAQVKHKTLDVFEHSNLPFEKLVQELNPDRDQSYPPIFQVMYTLQNREKELVPFEGLEVEPVTAEPGYAKFDLAIVVEDRTDGLAVWFEYNTDIFRPETMASMLVHFGALLNSIVSKPEAQIDDFKLLRNDEREALLSSWGAVESEYPSDQCIHTLFESQAAANPNATAVVFEDQRLTYEALNKQANQLAHQLIQSGVTAGTLVGLSMQRSADLIVGVLGILKAGGAYVPLDPNYPADRLRFIVEDSRCDIVVSHSSVEYDKQGFDGTLICTDQLSADLAETNPKSGVTADDLIYVIYTSGSTGKPKGALIEHRNVTRLLSATDDWFKFNQDDVWTLFHSYAFDFTVWELWGSLCYGGTLVVVPYLVSRSPDDFYALLKREQVTVLNQTPSAFAQLMRVDEQAGDHDELNLRYVIFGGEALDPQSLKPWMERHGESSPQLVNMYGITETTVHVTYRPLTLADCDDVRSNIGVPIPDLTIYVLDSQMEPVPTGIAGEMYVGGAGLARSYLNRPELTADRFIANPFNADPDDRLYRTGDLARYQSNGDIEYMGRADDQVKLRGFRIELGEIESALVGIEGVQQAVVLLREDRPGDKQLVAYLIASEETLPDHSDIRDSMLDRLPQYMVPSAFVELAAFPLTANGKLDKKALAPPDTSRDGEAEIDAPRTQLEEQLAEIWCEVLGYEVGDIGIQDDFFEIGGHSLLGTQLVSKVCEAMDVDLPLLAIFEASTIASFAEFMEENTEGTQQTAIPRRTSGSTLPLSFPQQRLWFLDQLESGSAVYNIPYCVELSGSLDVDVLQSALNDLVTRHESLRTTFVVSTGTPFQVISETAAASLIIENAPAGGMKGLRARLTQLYQQPMNLADGPLFSTYLLKQDEQRNILLLLIHHIIADGWSLEILLRELSVFYNARLQGKAAEIEELPIHYADYALWQRDWAAGDSYQAQLGYWREKLDGAPAALELPTDRPRPPVQSFRGNWIAHPLSPELSEQLRALGHSHNSTLFMLLLAAFNVLLARHSGQNDIVVGSPIAGRQRSELEGAIGLFLNMLPLRSDLSNNPGFADLLAQVRQTALDSFAHQDLPFEKLVEELQPTRDTSHAPIFQVLFILQNMPEGKISFVDLDSKQIELTFGTAKFD
ncbi:MAG: amino acid adenylation domain-containing protein, partial [Gammaproteobacteria bacterium]